MRSRISAIFPLLFWLGCVATVVGAPQDRATASKPQVAKQGQTMAALVEEFCLDCHSGSDAERGFDLASLEFESQIQDDDSKRSAYEKILKRLVAQQMPPAEAYRPSKKQYDNAVVALTQLLDHGHVSPDPLPAIRRLTRTEYQNAIRDVMGIQIDAIQLLPPDPSSHGFDNITVTELSPLLLDRYVKAAEHVARRMIAGDFAPIGRTVRLPADLSQEKHVDGLPFGTRGGTSFAHRFPHSGVYRFEMKLTRDRDEKVEGLNRQHHLDLLLDGQQRKRFALVPPKGGDWDGRDYSKSDAHLNLEIHVAAGLHEVCVTFPLTSSGLVEDKRQPFDANFNRHRHPRKTPALYQVSIVGPLKPPSSHQQPLILGQPIAKTDQARREQARTILSQLARSAFRRPLEPRDELQLLAFFDRELANAATGKDDSPVQRFLKAMELAVASILVHPDFLFRLESQGDADGDTGIEPQLRLASRLSFFLWSSVPDETLLQLAERGRLSQPDVLTAQVRRMLQDQKAEALVGNFADQWLHLRNLESITPDLRLFPDFDHNLRASFRLETQHLFRDVLRKDHSVLKLIDAKHTFLNERLAIHYGIPGVRGSHFRRVEIGDQWPRGGILRHGSVLMVTSYATRTSPTIRGNWVLENILGLPAPPPPPNVPNLKERSSLEVSTIKQRLEQHRKDPACASCHNLMDPIGFALENFDAVGRWRTLDDGSPVDSKGTYFDGSQIGKVTDLESKVAEKPELFVSTLTSKLMTYALGRMVNARDQPAIRAIVDQSKSSHYPLSEIVTGIVLSPPFQSKEKP